MIDLRDQIRSYAELLDAAAPPLSELVELPVETVEVSVPTPLRQRRWRPAFVAAAAAAVIVVATIGGVALLRDDAGPLPPASTLVTTAAPTTTLAPTPDPVEFSLVGGDAVLAPVEDHPYIGPGGVVFTAGQFHMFANSYRFASVIGEEPGDFSVLYLVSDDGVTWQPGAGAPVFNSTDVPFENVRIFVRSAVVDSQGRWQLFFDVLLKSGEEDDRTGEPMYTRSIGRAVAASPTGPWVIDAQPVLVPGDSGSWDVGCVNSPSVVSTGVELVMYYTGGPCGGDDRSVGRATSADGATWVKDAEPVLVADQDWERGSIAQVDALLVDGRWVLFSTSDTASRRGVATSEDGSAFTKLAENPVIDTSVLPRGSVEDADVVYREGRWYVFIENGGREDTLVSLVVYDGALPPTN